MQLTPCPLGVIAVISRNRTSADEEKVEECDFRFRSVTSKDPRDMEFADKISDFIRGFALVLAGCRMRGDLLTVEGDGEQELGAV